MVSVKYIFIVLRADDEGEGGTFALYSLLSRYVSIRLFKLYGQLLTVESCLGQYHQARSQGGVND